MCISGMTYLPNFIQARFPSKWNTHLYRKLSYKQGFERSLGSKEASKKTYKGRGYGKETAIVRKENISFSLFNWRGLEQSFCVCAPTPWPTRSLQGGRCLERSKFLQGASSKGGMNTAFLVFSNETTKLFSGITLHGKKKKRNRARIKQGPWANYIQLF